MDSSSDEDLRDDLSAVLDPETTDDTKKRLAYLRARNLTPSQEDRYELFHKFSFLPKTPEMKNREEKFIRMVNSMLGSKVTSDPIKLILSTAAKIYVARLVETSLEVAATEDYSGPLLPGHIHAAKRRVDRHRSNGKNRLKAGNYQKHVRCSLPESQSSLPSSGLTA